MSKLLPEFFRRDDEQPDALCYAEPHFETHLSADASTSVEGYYREVLPGSGHILDLMAGYVSHLPAGHDRVTGLGLNADELSHNPCLDDHLVFDLNHPGFLPFFDNSFDGVVCTEGVQYLVRPLEVFAEIGRTLKPGAPFVVAFSNRMLTTKVVLAWRATDSAARLRLVRSYFEETAVFGRTYSLHHEAVAGDPLYLVWAFRS